MRNKRRALSVLTIRIPADHVTKLAWIAEEKSTTSAEYVRMLVADAVRAARPPLAAKSREILASDAEWEKWTQTAARLNTTPAQLAAKLLNKVAERQAQ
jgi:hypothetical protein